MKRWVFVETASTRGSLAGSALDCGAVDFKIGSVGYWRGALMQGAKAERLGGES